MRIEYKKYKYEVLENELTQGGVESFFRALREDYGSDKVSGIEYQGNSVRVANKLGWINPDINVEESPPGLVRKISEAISQIIAESLETDPK